MVITKKQFEIFKILAKYPFKELTYKQLKINQNSNNFLTQTLKNFEEQKLIIKKKIGNLNIYKLNLNESNTINYLEILNNNGLNKLVSNTIKIIKKEITKITPFFSLIIFGSYALSENTKNSDLDILVLTESRNDKVLKSLNNAKLKSLLEIDSHIITQKEFEKMLSINEENLAKEILNKHKGVYNSHIFYDLLKKSTIH